MTELKEKEMIAVEQEERLGEVTMEIKTLNRQAGRIMLSYAIEIGKRLTEAKELVGHGNWGDYLEHEVSISASGANNFMRVYEEYGDQQISLFDSNRQAFGDLSYTKALALLALPVEERENFVKENDVEDMSTRELQAAIKERDEALRQARKTEVERNLAEQAKVELEKEMTIANARVAAADERVATLEVELRELKEKPVEVAVEKTVDQEALETARAEARAEAEEKLRAELEKAKAEAKAAKDKLAKAEEKAKSGADLVKAAAEKTNAAKAEAAQAREEAEKLRKELAASGNKAVTAFGIHFEAAQKELSKLLDCLSELEEAGDTENREKLVNAYRALLETFGEKVCACEQ